MRYIRLLVGSLVLLFSVVTAISLFIPSRVRISKAINVGAKPVAIEQQVSDMYKWQKWNPFFSSLPPGTVKFGDTSGRKPQTMEVNGTMVSWQQQKDNEYIAVMNREGRKPVVNGWKCITHTGSDSVTVQWYMDFHLNWYPWEKFGSLLFEKSYAAKMEQGLTALKKELEINTAPTQ